MNKTTKGAVAAASAAVLLAGGAGSLAYWSSTGSADAGSVSSGTLTLTPSSTAGVWKNGTSTISSIATYKIVPGDTIVYTKNFTLAAKGNNLRADVTVNTSGVSSTLIGASGAQLTSRVLKAGSAVTQVTAADDATTLTAELTVTFPSTVTGSTAQNLTADLSSVGLTATQTAPGTSGN